MAWSVVRLGFLTWVVYWSVVGIVGGIWDVMDGWMADCIN